MQKDDVISLNHDSGLAEPFPISLLTKQQATAKNSAKVSQYK